MDDCKLDPVRDRVPTAKELLCAKIAGALVTLATLALLICMLIGIAAVVLCTCGVLTWRH